MNLIKQLRKELIETLDEARRDSENILDYLGDIENEFLCHHQNLVNLKYVNNKEKEINEKMELLEDSLHNLKLKIKEFKECLTLQEIEK